MARDRGNDGWKMERMHGERRKGERNSGGFNKNHEDKMAGRRVGRDVGDGEGMDSRSTP